MVFPHPQPPLPSPPLQNYDVIGAGVSEPSLSVVNGDFVRPYGCMVLYTANTSITYFNGMPSLTLAPQCSAFTSNTLSFSLARTQSQGSYFF